MSATGIGASVRRTEDQRFITGKGHYTDDIARPGQAYAFFLRSPHAHAMINSIDTAAAKAMPGVLAVLTGAELANDKIGNLICGWMIHSKDGSPMNMAPHPALAATKVNHVGDAVAVIIAETRNQARDAAEAVKVDYAVLPAVADPAKAQSKDAPLIHEGIANNTIYQWEIGDAAAVDAAFNGARHVVRIDLVNNRLVPNAIEPRSALAEYDSGNDKLTLWNTSQNPHVARLVISAFVGHGAGKQAAGDRAGCRRRFRIEDFHLSGGGRLPMGRPQGRPSGKVDRRAVGGVHDRRARARSCHPCRACARRRRQDQEHAGEDHRQSRRLHVDLLVGDTDISVRYAAVGTVRHSGDLLRGGCGLYKHRAGRCLSRRRAAQKRHSSSSG